MVWVSVERPGYFGRRRDEKISRFNEKHGEGNWRLAWIIIPSPEIDSNDREMDGLKIAGEIHQYSFEFEEACRKFYEASYLKWFTKYPKK